VLIYEDINIKYQETSIDLSKLARFLFRGFGLDLAKRIKLTA